MAQQAKAYETVNYIAKNGSLVFQLAYADGYIAASQIKVKNGRGVIQIFIPESGTTEQNGNFILRPRDIVDKREIVLFKISEESAAPKVIRGACRARGILLNLIFNRAGK